MENEKKQINENEFKEGNFSSLFKKMAEMMRSCCPGEGKMADCCSMMRKMMQCGEGEEPMKKNKEN